MKKRDNPSTSSADKREKAWTRPDKPGELMTLAPSSMKYLRQNRNVVVCSGCRWGGALRNMMICSKCKIAVYCAQECQKRHWVIHKKECKQSKVPISFKLVHTFLSDPSTSHMFRQIFVASQGVDTEFTFDKVNISRCDLSVEPPLEIVKSLATGKSKVADYPNGVEGMLQIRGMRALDPAVFMDSGREKVWAGAKFLALVKRDGNLDLHWTEEYYSKEVLAVGIIDFHMDGTEQIIMGPVTVDEISVRCARNQHHDLIKKAVQPLKASEQAPLERMFCYLLNGRIQEDTKNLTRLRVHLPQDALGKYVGINVARYVEELPMIPPSMSVMDAGIHKHFWRLHDKPSEGQKN